MELRRSPTLEIGEKIKAASIDNRKLWSLSTPNLPSYVDTLTTDPSWGKLTPPSGMPELIEHTKSTLFNNWDQTEHEVIISAGAKSALFAILKTVTSSQDTVLLPSPTWPSYFDICTISDCKPIEMTTKFSNGFEFDLAEVEQSFIKHKFKVIMFSNPNNPAGIIYDNHFLSGLKELALKYGFYVVIDQSFSKIIFDKNKWSSSTCELSENIFIIDSFSKNFLLQGARVSATLVPKSLAENYTNIHQTILSSAPAPAQIMALNAIKNNLKMPSLVKQRAETKKFMELQNWEFVNQAGSFYYFPKVENYPELEERAFASDVLLLRGDIFGKKYKDHFRLCFARPISELKIIFKKLDGTFDGR